MVGAELRLSDIGAKIGRTVAVGCPIKTSLSASMVHDVSFTVLMQTSLSPRLTARWRNNSKRLFNFFLFAMVRVKQLA
jgi:hypothetical protein